MLLRRGARAAYRAARFVWREPRSTLLLVRMGAWVATLSLLFKFLPLPRVMQIMTPLTRRPNATRDPQSTQKKLARLIDLLLATDVLMFTPTCWKRAPVLYRYLALNGIETRVVFGVRKNEEGLLAGHAWLEADGSPLLETNFPAYTVTFSFPA